MQFEQIRIFKHDFPFFFILFFCYVQNDLSVITLYSCSHNVLNMNQKVFSYHFKFCK